MPRVNTSQVETSDSQEWTPLETGEYLMQIGAAQIAPSKFANQDGEHEDQLRVRWDLAEWREEWEDSGYMRKQSVFQQMRPWYGTGKKGDSKYKIFLDGLKTDGLISDELWIAGPEDADNQGDLIGIKRRVMVEKYRKTMGPNAGDWGNRVLAVTSLKTKQAQIGKTAGPTPQIDHEMFGRDKDTPTVPAPPAIPRKTAVTTTATKPAAPPKVIPPAKYFDDMLAEADDPALPMDQLIEIDAEFRRYAGGFWTTKERATDPDELRNQLRRMLGMITRNRNESQPEEDLAF